MSSDQSSAGSVQAVFFRELTHLVAPVTDAATAASNGDPAAIEELFSRMGAEKAALGDAYDPIEEDVTTIASAWSTIDSAVVTPLSNGKAPKLSEADDVVSAFDDVFSTIKGLDDIDLTGANVDFDAFGERVIDYLLVTYLQDYHSQAHSLLTVLGVIRHDEETGVPDVDLSAFERVLQDPNALMGEAFGWGLEEFTPYLILYYVRELVWELGAPAFLEAPSTLAQEQLQGKDGGDGPTVDEQQLHVRVLSMTEGGTSTEVGIQLIPLPARNGDLPGLAVMPFGTFDEEVTVDIDDQWTFNANLSAAAGWALSINPSKGDGTPVPDLVSLEGSFSGDIHGEAGLSFEGESGDPTTLLGNPEGSRVAVRTVSVSASVDYTGDEVVFSLELPATGTMGVDPADFDGFLQKVMPPDGIFYDFDATLGWSSDQGLYFERGGTLEAAIPQRVQLGPVTLQEMWLSAAPPSGNGGGAGSQGGGGASAGGGTASGGAGTRGQNGGGTSGAGQTSTGTIHIAGATSGALSLGPFEATVKRIGVEADVSFPDDADGNLGPADLQMTFKPPEGVGLSIDAGVVTGGGYLEMDPEHERYAGVLQLKVGDLTINAVGLLTTELPGGKDGFSLLIMVSGEFPPVQLGFGFTLNGVGGLAGVNRSVKHDPLGTAVREGSLDSVLFPENPVANSQRIISDLRTIFPPTSDVYVFGPMARLGWGTPTLITADLGVVLEIPTWKVVLLGRLSTLLPDEKAPLVEINLAVLGFLDPPNKYLSIQATLYDSRLVAWSISGDMAMRTTWGENPRFLLSVGGWNPRFDPPKDFADLDRITASLGPPSGNPSLKLTAYFAVTSNTVQAGAGAHLLAKAGPAKIEGRLAFDALVQFDPFKFIVDFLASLSVTIKGKGLSITLDGTISGPGPFHIKGKLHIEVVFITITVKVNATIGHGGRKEKLPPAHVLPKLTEELGKPGNWSAQRPETPTGMVTVRDVETDDDTVLAHPMGTIGVRQTVVPLDFEIEKFGNATPAGYTTFTIEGATSSGETMALGDATEERFAPAQYTKMSDAEKMDSPAFERHAAGVTITHGGLRMGEDGEASRTRNWRVATLHYESSVIDKTRDEWSTPLSRLGRFGRDGLDARSTIDAEALASLANVSAVANAPVRTTGTERFRLDPATRKRYFEHLSGAIAAVAGSGDDSSGGDGATASTGRSRAGDPDASAANGQRTVRRGGSSPDEGGLSTTVSPGDPEYVVASTHTLERVSIPTTHDGTGSKAEKRRALARYASSEPEHGRQLQVVPASKARGDGSATVDGGSAAGGDGEGDSGGGGSMSAGALANALSGSTGGSR